MKKLILISIVTIFLFSCKKKENTTVTPTNNGYSIGTPIEKTNGATVKLTSTPNVSSDKYLDVSINYLSGNTATYAYDVLIVYADNKSIQTETITAKGINTSQKINSSKFGKTVEYKLLLVRIYAGSTSDTLITLVGN